MSSLAAEFSFSFLLLENEKQEKKNKETKWEEENAKITVASLRFYHAIRLSIYTQKYLLWLNAIF